MLEKKVKLVPFLAATALVTLATSCTLPQSIQMGMNMPRGQQYYFHCPYDETSAIVGNKTSFKRGQTITFQIEVCSECLSTIKKYDSSKERTRKVYCEIQEAGSTVSFMESFIPTNGETKVRFDWIGYPATYSGGRIVDYRGGMLKVIPPFTIIP